MRETKGIPHQVVLSLHALAQTIPTLADNGEEERFDTERIPIGKTKSHLYMSRKLSKGEYIQLTIKSSKIKHVSALVS